MIPGAHCHIPRRFDLHWPFMCWCGHDAYIWQAKRLLADLRSVEEVTRP